MSSDSSALLSVAERALRDSLSPPDARDVHLYAFNRRTTCKDGSIRIEQPLPIVAFGSIVKDAEYFAKLLTAGFAESKRDAGNAIRQHALPSEYDYESDSDLDEFEEEEGATDPTLVPGSEHMMADIKLGEGKTGDLPAATRGYHIPIRNMAFRTMRACIFYLYVSKVNFMPLSSTGNRPAVLLTIGTSPPCSPKSMYRLAEAYGITELQRLAHENIISQLTTKNIVTEVFSTFFARYDSLREHAVSYLSQHYSNPEVQAVLPAFIDRIAWGELPHASGALRSLLGLRIAVAPPVNRDSTSTASAPLISRHPDKEKRKNKSRPVAPSRASPFPLTFNLNQSTWGPSSTFSFAPAPPATAGSTDAGH